jgi:hypothetical protein
MKFVLENTGTEFPRLVVLPENIEEANQIINKWAEETGFVLREFVPEKIGG